LTKMKFNVTLLALPLAASSAVLEPRQKSQARMVGTKELKPQFKLEAKRTVYKFGYYDLPGANSGGEAKGKSGGGLMGGMMGGMGHDNTLSGKSYFLNIKNFCNEKGPCTVYAGKVGVEFADGTPAELSKGIYIHHVLTTNTKKQTPGFLSSCNNPSGKAMSISSMGRGTGFVGVGEDSGDSPVMYTQRDGKIDAGYFVEQADQFTAQVELVNYNKTPQNVTITYDLEYVPGKVGVNTKGMLVSVTQCLGTRIKTAQTGPVTTQSGKFTLLEDGVIVGARGHLHDGGVQMDMSINGKHACTSKAGYGGESGSEGSGETISSMGYCDGPIPVKKGDALTMSTIYDLKAHPLRKGSSGAEVTGVMAMWSITFAPSK